MKIKTLKDIKPKFIVGTDLVAVDTFREQLRQEAIKWIKEYDNKINIAIKNNYESMAKTIMHTKEEFMKFSNITEEDCK